MRDNESVEELDVEPKLELGELRYLAKSMSMDDSDQEEIMIPGTDKTLAPSMNLKSSYGNPLSPVEAVKAVPSGSDGLIRHAIVVPDDFCVDGKLINGLNKRDFDIEKGTIKPRRANLPITQTDLMSSITKVDSEEGPRYIFNGILNGWPSLRHFELVSLQKKRSLPGGVQPPGYIMKSIGKAWTTYWRADVQGKHGNCYLRNTCRRVVQILIPSIQSLTLIRTHCHYQEFLHKSRKKVKFTVPLYVDLLGALLVGLQLVLGFFSGSKRNVLKVLVSSTALMQYQNWEMMYAKRYDDILKTRHVHYTAISNS